MWIHGEVDYLANLASSQTITLSWGAKKKESTKQRIVLPDESLQVGNHGVVENQGNYRPHKAKIIDIDMETNTASIRWETTWKVDSVNLKDLKWFRWRMHHQENENPQIFIILLQEKIASTEQCQYDRSDLEGPTENAFYCEKNSS